jgi:O-antigen ligase
LPPVVATALLAIALVAAILPPGYPAYIGGYVALIAAILALVGYGWSERAVFRHPTALAILAAIGLVALTLPFVYTGPADVLAPVVLLPMLSAIALGALARPAHTIPSPVLFASLCLLAVFIACVGGAYEHFVLGTYRPGLGNNPIHYASLAVMAGGLALVGVSAGSSPLRYIFLLGPILGLACAVIADSRGPMLSAVAMTIVGLAVLTPRLWHDRWFRVATLLGVLAGIGAVLYLTASGSTRIAGLIETGLNIFRFTGSSDDSRTALYVSALEMLRSSPVFGVGLGQIMPIAESLFPQQLDGVGLENLHADWANFAAMAGGLGLLAWLLLLAAPLLLLVDRRARQDGPIVLGAVLLTTGQIALGASNATFGVLPQTMVYAIPLGYFLARSRRLH